MEVTRRELLEGRVRFVLKASWPDFMAFSEELGLGLISGHAYSAPYEDVTLKSK